jgi:hypothetical protein
MCNLNQSPGLLYQNTWFTPTNLYSCINSINPECFTALVSPMISVGEEKIKHSPSCVAELEGCW